MATSYQSHQDRLTNNSESSRRGTITSEHTEAGNTAGLATSFSPHPLQRAIANPRQASPTEILALQRTYGNQAVQRLLKNSPKPAPHSQPSKPAQ